MDKLFAFGNKGTDRLLTDAYPLSTWDITDFRSELKVRCCIGFPYTLLFLWFQVTTIKANDCG